MNYVRLNSAPRGLNVFHLIHQAKRHPDMKRQRRARIEARASRAGRILKAAPISLRSVPLTPNAVVLAEMNRERWDRYR
jgi:hypothetical protein